MEVSGKVHLVGTEQQVSATFKKRELVIKTDEQYPQFISINFVQDKCSLLDTLNQNEEVNVSINLRGREWIDPQGEARYFNDIQGWRVSKTSVKNIEVVTSPFDTLPASEVKEEEHSDLPF